MLELPQSCWICLRLNAKSFNRRIDPGLREFAVSLVWEHFADFGPTLAAEKLEEYHGLKVSRETLRKWMAEDGLWLSVNGASVPHCRCGARLRDLSHLMVGSAFRNVRYKFVSQIVGRRDLRVWSPALAGCSEGAGRCGYA